MTELRDTIMMRNLAPRDRRAVLLGALILVPALLWVAAVRPYRAALEDIRERTATEQALLARERALLEAYAAPSAAGLDDRSERATLRLVSAANVPLAEAEVTTFLQELARLSRVLLQELRGVDPRISANARRAQAETPQELRVIRLSVRGESDFEGVITFLQRIEASPLLMRVTELSIEPVREGGRSGERRSDGVVTFMLQLEAFAPGDIEDAAALEQGT